MRLILFDLPSEKRFHFYPLVLSKLSGFGAKLWRYHNGFNVNANIIGFSIK